MTEHLMRFQEQLEEYPQIREVLLTVPKTLSPPITPPWRIYARTTPDAGWARKDFHTYKSAFDFYKLKRKLWHDISITSKRQQTPPPGKWVKLKRNGQPVMVNTPTGKRQATKLVPITPPPFHLWCTYCRRFTVFTWFTNHHAFRGEQKLLMDPSERRCCICGIRETTGAYRT